VVREENENTTKRDSRARRKRKGLFSLGVLNSLTIEEKTPSSLHRKEKEFREGFVLRESERRKVSSRSDRRACEEKLIRGDDVDSEKGGTVRRILPWGTEAKGWVLTGVDKHRRKRDLMSGTAVTSGGSWRQAGRTAGDDPLGIEDNRFLPKTQRTGTLLGVKKRARAALRGSLLENGTPGPPEAGGRRMGRKGNGSCYRGLTAEAVSHRKASTSKGKKSA